ncbi:MAG TPA: hypothetical protein VHJ56_00425, partial [Candidatus Binatia bacterium]|nr:hypothetical protein [Candidatus Binatia bacterium]
LRYTIFVSLRELRGENVFVEWCISDNRPPEEFAQAKTFKRYKVRRELVNALDEEARRKIGEEKQKQIEE